MTAPSSARLGSVAVLEGLCTRSDGRAYAAVELRGAFPCWDGYELLLTGVEAGAAVYRPATTTGDDFWTDWAGDMPGSDTTAGCWIVSDGIVIVIVIIVEAC
jgi:hypothetical protein